MKKIFTLALAFMMSTMAYSQVDVVYHVDVADYVASGNMIAANGIRIGGNFATQGATNGSTAMADWTPTDSASAMIDLGSDVWQITVTSLLHQLVLHNYTSLLMATGVLMKELIH